MEAVLAKKAGFCFGVDRAVKLVYEHLEKGEKIATLGPIIHNPRVISDLEKRGVRVLEKPEDAKKGEKVVIRAHGVPKSVYEIFEKNGIDYIDATCPFVWKIHKMVREKSTKSNVVMIAGDENHPEVIGFRSRSNGRSFVFSSVEQLREIVEKENLFDEELVFFAQTTFSVKNWEKIKVFSDNLLKNCSFCATICNTTYERQSEAENLSKRCDAMIVIGGKFSSNTVKLKDVCEKHCPTFLIESVSELETINLSDFSTVGITAGASTPANLIKEVLINMTDNYEKTETDIEELDYAKMLEESLKNFNNDPRCEGTVTNVTPTEIQLNIGRKFLAVLPAEEYSWDIGANHTEVNVGDKIWVKIMKTSEDEGIITVSKRLYDRESGFEKVKEALENGDVLTATVSEIRKGGVIVYPFGCRVFIPYSHCSLARGQLLDDILKNVVQFKIIKVDDETRHAVGSISEVTRVEREKKEAAFFETAEINKAYTGTITSVVPYGAFVDLGGVEALLHKSEISWKRINNVESMFKPGDQVDVHIIKIEDVKAKDDKIVKRVSVSMKKEEDLPWPKFVRTCNEGDVVSVKIIDFKTFGAIARLVDHNVRGLIHIREIANHYVENIRNELKINRVLDAKIIAIDTEKRRINLSVKALLEDEIEANADAYYEEASEEAAEDADAE